MQEVTIRNAYVEATASKSGAEIISFKTIENPRELIWCRDPKFWANCTPVLFPITAAIVDNTYTLDGKQYTLTQHGFARRSDFEFERVEADRMVLSLTANEATLALYPFNFKLTVEYKVVDKRLELKYTVKNLDEKPLPFMIGFHPAFNVPFTEGKSFEDYDIVFEKDEVLSAREMDLGTGNRVHLADALKTEPAQFFFLNGQLKSDYVDLTDGVNTIRVGIEGYETLGIWRKSLTTPFVCIEPWHPRNDMAKEDVFGSKLGYKANMLAVGEEFSCSYYFEIR